jgi:hypothetical protein
MLEFVVDWPRWKGTTSLQATIAHLHLSRVANQPIGGLVFCTQSCRHQFRDNCDDHPEDTRAVSNIHNPCWSIIDHMDAMRWCCRMGSDPNPCHPDVGCCAPIHKHLSRCSISNAFFSPLNACHACSNRLIHPILHEKLDRLQLFSWLLWLSCCLTAPLSCQHGKLHFCNRSAS